MLGEGGQRSRGKAAVMVLVVVLVVVQGWDVNHQDGEGGVKDMH